MIGVLSADEYYVRLKPGPILGQLFVIGQLFWAPATFLFGERPPHLVRGSYNPSTGNIEYRVDRVREKEFDEPAEPIHPLGIRSDERAAIVGIKRRPVVLLSQPVVRGLPGDRKEDDCFVVVPIYSFAGGPDKAPYAESMIERIKGYVYWQFFYLPPDGDGRILEGFARLDRLQVIHKSMLTQRQYALSPDALELLRVWLRVYLGEDLNTVHDVLFQYREQAIQGLRKQGLLP